MANVALLIGNTRYKTLPPLDCCEHDAHAIKELLDATRKFDDVKVLINGKSAQIKDQIRAIIDESKTLNEFFFYFTGHGFQHDEEFFFCCTDFDTRRPNTTGLSNTDLHTLLRPAGAALVVKVIDACYSGVLLVKADGGFLPTAKNGFKNLIQIAACLKSQNSLTGNPLSQFTGKFRSAALEKLEGPLYYSDIVSALRDEFLDNSTQTPHFVFQGTARELFVENAKLLDELRNKVNSALTNVAAAENVPSVTEQPDSVRAILERAERNFATRETATALISRLFDKLKERAASPEFFGELFDDDVVEHSNFEEPTTRAFIIRVLLNEKRQDNFVSLDVKSQYRQRTNALLYSINEMMQMQSVDVAERYELKLNCTLERAQLKITFTPRFVTLKRFVLVVSCVPSLEVCYVMEMLTEHPLRDWGVFDFEGAEVVRRWYKLKWTDPCDGLVDTIFDQLRSVVEKSVDAAAQALAQS